MKRMPRENGTEALKSLAERVVALAAQAGAPVAEAFVERTREASVSVRHGNIETLSEASGKGVGLRVIVDTRLGFASTTDFSDASLQALVERAVALAREAAPDESNRLPGTPSDDVADVAGLYDPHIADIDPRWKLDAAFELERAARAEDARCDRFEGSGAGERVREMALCNSSGVLVAQRSTTASLWCAPVASDGASMQTGYWSDAQRQLVDLQNVEDVGRRAARRAVRMLGARPMPTCRVPVVFDPIVAGAFFASIAQALDGESVRKGASFLAQALGNRVAPQALTLSDEPHLARGLASTPFDGEGVPTHPLSLIDEGVVRHFIYDTRTAFKAGAASTGHARRSYASLPFIQPSNLRVRAGNDSPERLIADVSEGLYVTGMLGRGANIVTGDYSRGATGLWIQRGELTHPVQEMTVAGHLLDMLERLVAVGNDVTVRGAVGAPTVRFDHLAVGGR